MNLEIELDIHFKCTAQASCSGCTATRPITKLVSASIGPARAAGGTMSAGT